MFKLQVGQVIDLYNVKDHHVLAKGQTLCDTGEYEYLPKLINGIDLYGNRDKSAWSVLYPGVDAVKVARFRVKEVKNA